MRRRTFIAIAGLSAAAALAAATGPAAAQDWKAKWDALVAKAKTQKVVLTQHGNDAIPPILDAFEKKFGISVEQTAARPSRMLSRVRTEQKNGLYQWDIWLAASSNMTNIAAPAGMMEDLDNYLILPEVKDMSNWRHPKYLFGDKNHRVITFQNYVTNSVFRNVDVVPDVKVRTFDDMMNPKLKGKIAIRDSSRPNAALFVLALMQQQKGADFVKRFLKEMSPTIYEDPKQIFNAVVRGGAAIGIGARDTEYSRCVLDGGCKNIDPATTFNYVLSWGISIFKKPPHPEAATVFLNWFLSKEGQEIFTKQWTKYNLGAGVSMRKDVPIPEGRAEFLPDFSKPDEYLWVAHDKEGEKIKAAVATYREAKGE